MRKNDNKGKPFFSPIVFSNFASTMPPLRVERILVPIQLKAEQLDTEILGVRVSMLLSLRIVYSLHVNERALKSAREYFLERSLTKVL